MTNTEKKRALVFAPHPDDEIIGCGGSIVKLLATGWEVFVALAGDTTNISAAHMTRSKYINARMKEIPLALAALSINTGHTIMGSENNPWHYSEENVRDWALQTIRQIRPHRVYLPHPEDAHVDHKIVGRAVLDAVSMAPSNWFLEYDSQLANCPPVETVLAYEVWTLFSNPTYYEALTAEQVETAMAALSMYQSQETFKYEPAYL